MVDHPNNYTDDEIDNFLRDYYDPDPYYLIDLRENMINRIENGLNVNHIGSNYKETLLSAAIRLEDIDFVKILIEYGANPNLKLDYSHIQEGCVFNSFELARHLCNEGLISSSIFDFITSSNENRLITQDLEQAQSAKSKQDRKNTNTFKL